MLTGKAKATTRVAMVVSFVFGPVLAVWRLAIAVAESAGLEFGARVRRDHAEGHLCEQESGSLSRDV